MKWNNFLLFTFYDLTLPDVIRPFCMATTRRLHIGCCLADGKVESRLFPIFQMPEVISQQGGIVISRIAGIIRGNAINGCPVASLIHEIRQIHIINFQSCIQIIGIVVGHGLYRTYHHNLVCILIDCKFGVAGIIPRLVVDSLQSCLYNGLRRTDGVRIHITEVGFRPYDPGTANVSNGISE